MVLTPWSGLPLRGVLTRHPHASRHPRGIPSPAQRAPHWPRARHDEHHALYGPIPEPNHPEPSITSPSWIHTTLRFFVNRLYQAMNWTRSWAPWNVSAGTWDGSAET